ncbi:MAG: TonB-dependent receptor, partial [Bacteroidota bacterium]
MLQFKPTMPLLVMVFMTFMLTNVLDAQTQIIKGQVFDAQSELPVKGVKVQYFEDIVYTEADGRFYIIVPYDSRDWVITLSKDGYRSKDAVAKIVDDPEVDLGRIALEPEENIDQFGGEDLIPTISLEIDAANSLGAQNISGLLTASRDAFVSAAAFNFGAARFRIRGYDGRNTTVMMNGVPVNDAESGFTFWSNWGGLNDVLRNRTNTVGLGINPGAFGGVGGTSTIDTRASIQRKQLRVSHAVANRTYTNRTMATYSTGALANGWAFTFSGSRRWAEEGFIPGTFYDGYSYFLSIDRELSDRHSINLTAFGAPIKRGRSSAATMEMNDLAGTNYYNPNWGFQNGEKRNARVANQHQPIVIFRHDWKWTDRTILTTSVMYQTGRNGTTAIDWYDARDPRPDYYRRLPSFIQNEQSDDVEEALRNDITLRQVNWDYMYNVNRNNTLTIENADGRVGNNVTGNRAQYVIEDRRFDADRLNIGGTLESVLSDKVRMTAGAVYQQHDGRNYKVLDDLLGADFYVDIDKFAEFDSTSNSDFIQNNLDVPNGIVEEGDVFGYDYEVHVRKASGWLQFDFTTPRFDLFVGGSAGGTRFWRTGLVRNGKFPEDSFGDSEQEAFLEYGGKAGLTYKLDGRNYIVANASYMSRAPYARNAFVSPRTRNQIIDNLNNETIYSVEGSYLLRAPYAKLRITAYYTQFDNILFNRSFFLDNVAIDNETTAGFVNYILTGIGQRHSGFEIGSEIKLFGGLSLSASAAIGEYVYTERPEVNIYLDNQATPAESEEVFIDNFKIPNTPQTAANVTLRYQSPQYWFANISLNYFDDIYLDINPSRRTTAAVALVDDPQFASQYVEPGSDLWNRIILQEKAPSAYTLDFFGGKSWKLGEVFLYLNVGVNNILDKQDFITGGYEQFRF